MAPGRRRAALRLGVLLLDAAAVASAGDAACCRFAEGFARAEWGDEATRRRFIDAAVAAERRFFAAAGVAFDPDTGMTYDGHPLDAGSGELRRGAWPAGPSVFSAASKESLHLALLALSLPPSGDARLFAPHEALRLLEQKVDSLEAFDARYPGFGGFLPWFCSRGAEPPRPDGTWSCRTLDQPASPVAPTADWASRVPALDNGQLAWATYAVVKALKDLVAAQPDCGRAAKLARRWAGRLARMRQTAVPLFYHGPGSGRVRSIAQLHNVSAEPSAPSNAALGFAVPTFLDDPYEGELMVFFMDLLAEWPGYQDGGSQEKALMWERKRRRLLAANYTSQGGMVITTQQGYWFSAHESWKLLVLPYLDLPLVRTVFRNSEYVRLLHSAERRIPGLFASSHAPPNVRCGVLGGYCNAVGVQAVASQAVLWNQSVTPYGAFPAILMEPEAGLAWYHLMLSLPQMQSPYGSVESSNVDGTAFAPVLTWDAKITTVLAMLGGTGPLLKQHMEREGLLDRFTKVVGEMYTPVFHGIPGCGPLPLPPSELVQVGRPLPTCTCASAATSPPRILL